MELSELTDEELGGRVRASPLWSILLEMEKKDAASANPQRELICNGSKGAGCK